MVTYGFFPFFLDIVMIFFSKTNTKCYSFASQEKDALLFYNGRFNDLHDFMALEIVDAQIQFSFSTGDQVVKVSPFIEGGVNDGKWHQVTVDYLNMVCLKTSFKMVLWFTKYICQNNLKILKTVQTNTVVFQMMLGT